MVVGHIRIQEYLSKVLVKTTWAHAYLFFGPPHVGKTTVAGEFKLGLLCGETSKKIGGCGKCRMCLASETTLAGRFYSVAPRETVVDDKKKIKEIGIGEIHDMRRWLSFATSSQRVVIISDAEAMSGEAANSMLKILEEPDPKTIFILVSSTPEYLLPTIRSRTVPLRFGLVSDGEMKKIKGIESDLISLAEGRPGIAISAMGDALKKKKLVDLKKSAFEIWRGTAEQALVASKQLSESGEDERTLTFYVMSYIKNELALADTARLPSLIRRVRRAHQIFSGMQTTNVNRRLALDLMLLNLQKIGT